MNFVNMRSNIFALLLFSLLTLPVSAQVIGDNFCKINGLTFSKKDLLVELKASTDIHKIEKLNFEIKEFLPQLHKKEYCLILPEMSCQELLDLESDLKSSGDFEHVSLDYIFKAETNDTYFRTNGSGWDKGYDELYGLKNSSFPDAWESSTGLGAVVAVIDSGVDFNHEDLKRNLWIDQSFAPQPEANEDGTVPEPKKIKFRNVDKNRDGRLSENELDKPYVGYNFVDDNNNPQDDNGHGTHIAGIIAARGDNGKGTVGAAYRAKIMPLKALNATGFGTLSDIAEAVTFAADHGADVINSSLACENCNDFFLQEAYDYAESKGVISVAAAGNESSHGALTFPAAFESVISVGAVDNNNIRPFFSNFGTKFVDVAAPGFNIVSTHSAFENSTNNFKTLSNTNYAYLSGTSMAAAYVSGLAALMKSLSPDLTLTEFRQLVRASTKSLNPVDNLALGTGVINAKRAMQQLLNKESLIAQIHDYEYNFANGKFVANITAEGNAFRAYDLVIYPYNSRFAEATVIQSSDVPGELEILRRKMELAEGLYILELRVYDDDGNYVGQKEVFDNFPQPDRVQDFTLTMQEFDNRPKLDWSYSADSQVVVAFNIFRSIDGDPFELIDRVLYRDSTALVDAKRQFTYTDTQRAIGQKVRYRIRAHGERQSGLVSWEVLADAPNFSTEESQGFYTNGLYVYEAKPDTSSGVDFNQGIQNLPELRLARVGQKLNLTVAKEAAFLDQTLTLRLTVDKKYNKFFKRKSKGYLTFLKNKETAKFKLRLRPRQRLKALIAKLNEEAGAELEFVDIPIKLENLVNGLSQETNLRVYIK